MNSFLSSCLLSGLSSSACSRCSVEYLTILHSSKVPSYMCYVTIIHVLHYHLTCTTFKDSEIMQSASHNISQLKTGIEQSLHCTVQQCIKALSGYALQCIALWRTLKWWGKPWLWGWVWTEFKLTFHRLSREILMTKKRWNWQRLSSYDGFPGWLRVFGF